MPEAAVIILHYKNYQDTVDCLISLKDSSLPEDRLKLYVSANNETGDFSNRLTQIFDWIEVETFPENTGYAKANNRLIEKAVKTGAKIVILLNNDTVLAKDSIEKLLIFSSSDKKIGLVSPKIYFAPNFEHHKNRYRRKDRGKVLWYAGGIIDWSNIYAYHRGVDEVDQGQYNETDDTDFTTGCCMVIKKEVIEAIGYLDAKYFLYYEDVDYSTRAKKAGFRTVYYPQAHLWHKNASSSGRPGSVIHRYYQTRNRLYFGFKYAGFRTKKSLAVESAKMLTKNTPERKAVLDFYMGKMGIEKP